MKDLKDFRRASDTFDSIAEHFDKTRDRPWKEVVEFIEGRQGYLLAMGCGNGRHMLEGAKRGLRVVGIDASKRLLEIAKTELRKKTGEEVEVEVVRSDVKSIPFQDRSFDHIIYIATIHHLKEGRVESLEEAKRVLKPDGEILVSCWARELERWDIEKDQRDVIVPWHHEDGEVIERYYHLFTLDELKSEVEKSGLSVLKAFRSGGNNYVKGKRLSDIEEDILNGTK